MFHNYLTWSQRLGGRKRRPIWWPTSSRMSPIPASVRLYRQAPPSDIFRYLQFMYIFMQDNFQFHNILSFGIFKYPLILIFLLSTVLVCQVYRQQPVGLLGLAAFGNDLPPDFPPQTEVLFDLNVSPIESNLGLHWCPSLCFFSLFQNESSVFVQN